MSWVGIFFRVVLGTGTFFGGIEVLDTGLEGKGTSPAYSMSIYLLD